MNDAKNGMTYTDENDSEKWKVMEDDNEENVVIK